MSPEERKATERDPLHALVCNAFGYDKSIVRGLALGVKATTTDPFMMQLAQRVLETESLARSRSLCVIVHPMPDTNHPYQESESDRI